MNTIAKAQTLLFVLILIGACGPQGTTVVENGDEPPLEDPERDDTLENARGLFDFALEDSVDPSTGDFTDILYILVDRAGSLTVLVNLTENVDGTVSLLNQYGDTLASRTIGGARIVRIEDFDVFPGRYYVSLTSTGGLANYTIQQSQDEGGGVTTVVGSDSNRQRILDEVDDLVDRDRYSRAISMLRDALEEDPDWDEGRAMIARIEDERDEFCDRNPDICNPPDRPPENGNGNGETNGGTDLDEQREDIMDRVDDLVDAGEYEEAIDLLEEALGDDPGWRAADDRISEIRALMEEPPPSAIRATILNMRQLGSSETELRLRGCGSSSGLSEGDRGSVGDIDVEITRITSDDACEATASGSPGEIGSASHVEF